MKRLSITLGYFSAILAVVLFVLFGIHNFERGVISLLVVIISLLYIMVCKISSSSCWPMSSHRL